MTPFVGSWPAGATTTSLVLSGFALVVSGIAFWRQQQAVHKLRNMPLVVDLFHMLRLALPDRRFVIMELGGHDPKLGVSGLEPTVRDRVTNVCHLFDNIGMMVAHGLVSYELVGGYAGEAVIRAWRAVAPFVRVEQQKRQGPYQEYFHYLALRAEREPAQMIREKAMGGPNPEIETTLPHSTAPIPVRR